MNNGKQGSVLVMMLVVMTALSLAVGSLLPVSIGVYRYTVKTEAGIYARQNAYSGLAIVKKFVHQEQNAELSDTIEMNQGSVEIYAVHTQKGYEVTITGICAEARFRIKRIIP